MTNKQLKEAYTFLVNTAWKDEVNKMTALKLSKILKPIIEEQSQKLYEIRVKAATKGKNGLVEKDKDTGDFNFTEDALLSIEEKYREYMNEEVEISLNKTEVNTEIKELSIPALMALDGVMFDL